MSATTEHFERIVRAVVAEAYKPQRPEPDAHTIEQFCERHNISRSTFYELARKDEGPRTFKVGISTRISREAAADWRRERANATSPKGEVRQ